MSSGCIFCKIAAGEIPATVVKRSDGMLAFKDLNAQAPTHLLVIPTTHVGTLNDAKDPGALGKLMAFARDVAQESGIATKGYRVVVNNAMASRLEEEVGGGWSRIVEVVEVQPSPSFTILLNACPIQIPQLSSYVSNHLEKRSLNAGSHHSR